MAAYSVFYPSMEPNASSAVLVDCHLGHDLLAKTLPSEAMVVVTAVALFALCLVGSVRKGGRGKGKTRTPVANRLFWWEPSWFARLRWAIWAKDILDEADAKSQGKAYMLSRGDKDLVVLPPKLLPELNRMGPQILNSRRSHAFMLLGHLTGMGVVEKTSHHVRILLSRISPALPELFRPFAGRLFAAIDRDLSKADDWTMTKMNPIAIRSLSEAMSIILFGPELAQNPRLAQLSVEITMDVFTVAFIMRLVPAILQPILVWLLPAKWRMIRRWEELRSFVAPEVLRHMEANKASRKDGASDGNSSKTKSKTESHPDLISWMVKDGKTDMEKDPDVLTTLCGSVAAGSIFSIANFACRVLSNLAAHPEVMEAVRQEIRAKHARIQGKWDTTAVATDMDCLESVMKETARHAPPGTVLVYSRVVERDFSVDGYELKKDQFVTMSWSQRSMNPDVFQDPTEFQGLRFCEPDMLQQHRAKPFRGLDNDIFAWGAGRWACPGRHVADMSAKLLLIKLLDGYDFELVDGKPLPQRFIHEFGFADPNDRMLVRRRRDAVGISCDLAKMV